MKLKLFWWGIAGIVLIWAMTMDIAVNHQGNWRNAVKDLSHTSDSEQDWMPPPQTNQNPRALITICAAGFFLPFPTKDNKFILNMNTVIATVIAAGMILAFLSILILIFWKAAPIFEFTYKILGMVLFLMIHPILLRDFFCLLWETVRHPLRFCREIHYVIKHPGCLKQKWLTRN